MIVALQLGLLVQLFAAGSQPDPQEFIRVDRLSQRVVIAYWPGIDRRCNLTAIQSEKVWSSSIRRPRRDSWPR